MGSVPTSGECRTQECSASRPGSCPGGCDKEISLQTFPEQSYRDIHAPPTPKNHQDHKWTEHSVPPDHIIRQAPPGSKATRKGPSGGTIDRVGTEGFFDAFDCQEQPWRSSIQSVPMHQDHSSQRLWSVSGAHVKVPLDNLGEFANSQDAPEWRSSRTSVPSAHDYGKPWIWRPCIRYIGANTDLMKERNWRPSVHLGVPRGGDLERPYSSSIKVKGSPPYDTWKETTALPFRPNLRHIPESDSKARVWKPSRGHPCSRQCLHRSQDFARLYRHSPEKENTGLSFRPCIKYIPEYSSNQRGWRPSRSHKCSRQCLHQKQQFAHLYEHRMNHTAEKDTDTHDPTFRPSRKLIKGPQHYSVQNGSVIFRPLGPGLEVLPPSKMLGPKALAPQGKLNEFIIDGHFHRFRQSELTTEQRAQYQNCKPCLRKEIFDDVNQASKKEWASCHMCTPFDYEASIRRQESSCEYMKWCHVAN